MIELKEVFAEWKDRIDHPIVAIETGCSFMWGEGFDPYISSLNIMKHLVQPTDGELYSLDNDGDNLTVCFEELHERDLDRRFTGMEGDSVESIKKLASAHKKYILNKVKVNFVWLDSSEDADHAMAEYEAIKPMLSDKHVICVDDYDCPNSVKWQGISQIIKDTFKEYKTYKTPTGLIVGYNG